MQIKLSSGNTFDVRCAIALKIDGKPVPAGNAEYLVAYGIRQKLQDAYASEKDNAARREIVADLMEKVLTGNLTIRESGGRTSDPFERELNRLARDYAEKRVVKEGRKVKDYSKAEFAALVERYRTHEPVRAMAQANVAAAAAVPELEL